MSTSITIVSLFAALLSMISYVPQAWSIVRSGRTDGLSLKTYLLTVVGFLAWLTYGVLVGQWPIIVQNVICLGLATFILVMMLMPDRKTAEVAEKLRPSGTDQT